MLSTTAQHALRALVELACLGDGESLGGRDLSRLAGIPPNYLAKILRTLSIAGLVDATRGTGGGYRLRRSPASIHLGDVVELFDPARCATDCLLDATHPCSDDTACAAHDDWRHVKEAYVGFLRATTLAALAARQK